MRVPKHTQEERLSLLDQKADELSRIQQDQLVADYDEAIAEHENGDKPKYVKFAGEYFEISKEMPFRFATFYFRHCVRKVKGKTQMEVPEDKMFEFIELMLGKKFLERLEQSDAGVHFVFKHIVPDIMSMWGYDVKSDKPSGGQKKTKTRG
ncbi:hypothetical protein [Halalkalibacterium halodurans]|uniref:hypothetical protein n=1 Tax=Halalkalibacterium halodurans TaxID=86665 RepID=UPI0010FE3C90|nr:hypothetical protein AMD02_019065 [Halalkalibacterium halodurans]